MTGQYMKLKSKELNIEPAWSCEVRRAGEGYIVETLEELAGDPPIYRVHEAYCEDLQHLFWEIAEHFGEYKAKIKVTDGEEQEQED